MRVEEKNIALVVNPTRSKAARIAAEISSLLSQKNIDHTNFTAPWPKDFSGFTEVWIVGGDGTLNFFINRYSEIDLPLAIFSGGTGNDFHWMLYGNVGTKQQVEKVLAGQPKWIDAGKCNERFFLNNVGIGFDAKVSKDLTGKEKRSGKMAYWITVLKNILFFPEFFCTLLFDEKKIEQDCLMVSICNGKRTGGNFYLAPEALCEDGLLDICIVGKVPPLKRLKYLPIIQKGKHLRLPFVHYRQVESVRLNAPKLLHAHVDGEYFLEENFTVKCLSKKFSFIV